MSTVNLVKYYFYQGMKPKDEPTVKRLIALAYQTARATELHPRAILIRSMPHNTTTVNGRHVQDPDGWHITFCYKDNTQVASEKHTTCHGYMPSKTDYTLVKATNTGEKPDATLKGMKVLKEVWPPFEDLEEVDSVGYGHFP